MSFNYSTDDLENASTGNSNTVEPGEYQFTITHAEERESKAGNTYASMTCTINNNGTERDIRFTKLHFTPKSMGILKKFIDTTGITPPKGATDLVGAKGTCVVDLNEDGWPEVVAWGKGRGTTTTKKKTTSTDAGSIPF